MIDQKSELVRVALEAGTGADVSLRSDRSGFRNSLEIWFSDLTRSRGPVVTLGPSGLRRHRVELKFGPSAGKIIKQIRQADVEAVKLARALTSSISKEVKVEFPGNMNRDDWVVEGRDFHIFAEKKGIDGLMDDHEIVQTCEEIVVPILAAFAELIGYSEVMPALPEHEASAIEGDISLAIVRKRERNPRNRLLALRIHGSSCVICRTDPKNIYGSAGQILEVHHLVPLSSLGTPRAYDPSTDLVPLCPNCHRVVHNRRPVPYEPSEVMEMIESEKL
nr:HNH endonuclease [uncultured Roseibium sp.]